MKPILLSVGFVAVLTGCATHKDLLYSFTVTGSVVCSRECTDDAAIRVLDTGLDYKRKHQQFEFAKRVAPVGASFNFDADYFWGYTKVAGSSTTKRMVTIEASVPGCGSVRREIDLESVPSNDAHFMLDVAALEVECVE